MNKSISAVISLFCAAAVCASVFCACSDPNVKPEENSSDSYVVDVSGGAESETLLEGFHSYGAGKTDPVEVSGVEVKVGDFALRSYQLAFMMAQTNFDKPGDIPLDLLVQYAFSHTLFKNLNEMTNHAVQYRSASEEDIRAELKKQFGTDDFPVTDSVLYNPEKKLFEMWIPEYGTNIFYTIDAVNVDGSQAEIITTFYNELERKTLLGRTTITVKISDGAPVIASLKAE